MKLSIKKPIFLLIAYCLLLIAICQMLNAKQSFAQQEIDDYLFQYQKYQENYKEFTTARDTYLKYQTLESQEQAIMATKNLMLKRNEVLRAYFLALKIKLRTTPGIVSTERQAGLISRLDQEIIWLEKENKQILGLSNPSLDDLFLLSDHTENKKEDFSVLAYESLSTILMGKAQNLQAESIAMTAGLTDKVLNLEASKSGQLKEWLKTVENQNYLSQKEIESMETKYGTLATERREDRLGQVFVEIQNNLGKFLSYLNQALGFQKEILSSFTYESRL